MSSPLHGENTDGEQAGPDGTPVVTDPVLIRRERIRMLCDIGQRIGYSCFAAAVVLFVIAFIAQFPSWLVTIIIGAMVVGSITLCPAIVLGYAVKAADADDRGEKFGY